MLIVKRNSFVQVHVTVHEETRYSHIFLENSVSAEVISIENEREE